MSLDSIRIMIAIETKSFLMKLMYFHLYASLSKCLNCLLSKMASLARTDGLIVPNAHQSMVTAVFEHEASKLVYNFLINM